MAVKRIPEFRAELERISAVLFDDNAGFAALYAAANDYLNLLCGAAQFDATRLKGDEGLASSGGKAIGPLWAAWPGGRDHARWNG